MMAMMLVSAPEFLVFERLDRAGAEYFEDRSSLSNARDAVGEAVEHKYRGALPGDIAHVISFTKKSIREALRLAKGWGMDEDDAREVLRAMKRGNVKCVSCDRSDLADQDSDDVGDDGEPRGRDVRSIPSDDDSDED